MEHTNKKKLNRDKVQLAMVIGIYLAIVLLLIAIIVIVKNIKEIQDDPLIYGIKEHNYLVCSCYDKDGNNFDFNSDGYIDRKEYGWNIDLPKLE